MKGQRLRDWSGVVHVDANVREGSQPSNWRITVCERAFGRGFFPSHSLEATEDMLTCIVCLVCTP